MHQTLKTILARAARDENESRPKRDVKSRAQITSARLQVIRNCVATIEGLSSHSQFHNEIVQRGSLKELIDIVGSFETLSKSVEIVSSGTSVDHEEGAGGEYGVVTNMNDIVLPALQSIWNVVQVNVSESVIKAFDANAIFKLMSTISVGAYDDMTQKLIYLVVAQIATIGGKKMQRLLFQCQVPITLGSAIAMPKMLSERNVEKKRKKMDALADDICVYTMENERSNDTVFGLTEDQEKLGYGSDTLAKLNNYKGQISNKVATITKEHKFFTDNVTCPTCTQPIEESFRLNKIKDVQLKAKELQSGYQELEQTIKKEQERERQFTTLSKEITKLTHGISKNNTLISNCQRQQRDLESEIQTLTEQLENRNTEHNKLEKFKSTLQETYESLATHNQTIKYYNFTYELLKDGGVKTKIIKKYLPLINQQVNRYLQMMDFYINFTLDEEFNETIESPIHEDFSYSSFSEGEKQRIDLALLFTWREVAKFKNSVATNLMILDEVFDSSLDATGTEEFLKIIRYVIKDANIFIISHKNGLEDKFEDHIRFEKHKGFSRIIS